jgi:hypothetical protein
MFCAPAIVNRIGAKTPCWPPGYYVSAYFGVLFRVVGG